MTDVEKSEILIWHVCGEENVVNISKTYVIFATTYALSCGEKLSPKIHKCRKNDKDSLQLTQICQSRWRLSVLISKLNKSDFRVFNNETFYGNSGFASKIKCFLAYSPFIHSRPFSIISTSK